nr:hypothetical protein [uncultured Desulfobacter sp.]
MRFGVGRTFHSDQADTYMDNITVDENGALIAGGSYPEAPALAKA